MRVRVYTAATFHAGLHRGRELWHTLRRAAAGLPILQQRQVEPRLVGRDLQRWPHVQNRLLLVYLRLHRQIIRSYDPRVQNASPDQVAIAVQTATLRSVDIAPSQSGPYSLLWFVRTIGSLLTDTSLTRIAAPARRSAERAAPRLASSRTSSIFCSTSGRPPLHRQNNIARFFEVNHDR